MGFTQNFEIWHGSSLGTLIMIQEEPIWRNRWGPCFGHKGAIFWPFLGKGDYGIHPELWNLAWSIPGHIDYESGEPIWGTMWGPCLGHKGVIFWPFLWLLIHWVGKWKPGHSCRPLVLFYIWIISELYARSFIHKTHFMTFSLLWNSFVIKNIDSFSYLQIKGKSDYTRMFWNQFLIEFLQL